MQALGACIVHDDWKRRGEKHFLPAPFAKKDQSKPAYLTGPPHLHRELLLLGMYRDVRKPLALSAVLPECVSDELGVSRRAEMRLPLR